MPVQNLKSNLDMMRINPAHISQFDNGFVLDNRHITTIYDTEPPEHVVYVSPNFNDDEDNFKFSTIQGAIDYIYGSSWYSSLSANNRALVIVYPGIYTEQIHSYRYILIYGSGIVSDTTTLHPSPTLYNTGADSAHYPFRSDEDERFEINGFRIETDVGGIFGKIPKSGFVDCRFVNGNFIERNSSCLAMFSGCAFDGNEHGGFNFFGSNLTGYRNILLRSGCRFTYGVVVKLLSTHTNWGNFQCEDVNMHGSVNIKGDWAWRTVRCFTRGSWERNIFDTTNAIEIYDSSVVNGIHFLSEPSDFRIMNSNFESLDGNQIPDGEADITSDVVIPSASYYNNIQHNGICGNVQIQCPIKSVGCVAPDRYFSIQDAIDSIPTGETGVVDLRESFIDLTELTITPGANITIDGHKVYSLTFTGDIVEVPANSKFSFADMVGVTGGNIEMNGANAELSMESCQYVSAYVTLTNGAFAILYKSSLFGSTGHKAITVDTTTPIIVVGYSRVQGATGHEAVTFSVDADDKFKAKYSTFIHGDKDTSEPLTYTGATGKVDIACYNCGLNAAWNPAKLYNTIGSANNTTDTAITF